MAEDISLTLTVGSYKTITQTISCNETSVIKVRLPAGASDTNVKLGLITDAKFISVFGAEGVSFKLDSTGTDAIQCNPGALVSEADLGNGVDEILLSNAGGVEVEVVIVAGE